MHQVWKSGIPYFNFLWQKIGFQFLARPGDPTTIGKVRYLCSIGGQNIQPEGLGLVGG